MRTRPFFAALAPFAALLSTATPASADSDEAPLYINHSGRLTAQVFRQSGDDVTVTGPASAYARYGGGVAFDAGYFFDKTRFGTRVGVELSTYLGYSALPTFKGVTTPADPDASGKLQFRLDGGPSYALFHWRGAIPGQLTFLPGMGFTADGARVYKGYAYFYVGGRATIALGKKLDVTAQYVHVPGTTADMYIREHRFEGFANIESITVGARLQHDTTELGDRKTAHTTLTGLVGYTF